MRRRSGKLSDDEMNVVRTFHNQDTMMETTSSLPVVPGRMAYPGWISFIARCTPIVLVVFYAESGFCKVRDARPSSTVGLVKYLLEKDGAMVWVDMPAGTKIEMYQK